MLLPYSCFSHKFSLWHNHLFSFFPTQAPPTKVFINRDAFSISSSQLILPWFLLSQNCLFNFFPTQTPPTSFYLHRNALSNSFPPKAPPTCFCHYSISYNCIIQLLCSLSSPPPHPLPLSFYLDRTAFSTTRLLKHKLLPPQACSQAFTLTELCCSTPFLFISWS